MYHSCLLFLTGVVLAFAYDDLSKNKVATQSTTVSIPADIYTAGKAVDRDITTCMRAKEIGENSPYKTVWWTVDLGGVYNIHSVNLLFKNYDGQETRQRGRFAGFSLYVSNTGAMYSSNLCYKDGPQLPSLNFTTTCNKTGRYVTFYNERVLGVTYPYGYQLEAVYTEICEVIVQGCQTFGVYGHSCNERCPTNCRDDICHIETGTCFGCESGWIGTTCKTKCTAGWYGLDCKQQCSGHCRDNHTCNHVTSLCDEGCAAGWRGSECNKECAPGYFGYGCKNICKGHCVNNAACDRIDGTCNGCQDGFEGTFCNESCKEGFYDRNCSLVCSSNCRTCKSTDGTCTCYTGWRGSNCNTVCMWSYGEDCQYPCNKHCINQTCDRFNGSCLFRCESGYYGPKCDQEYPLRSLLSAVSSGFIGASVSVFVVLTTAFVIFIIRRKKFCFSRRPSTCISNKESPYAEIENQPSRDSTYLELTA